MLSGVTSWFVVPAGRPTATAVVVFIFTPVFVPVLGPQAGLSMDSAVNETAGAAPAPVTSGTPSEPGEPR